MTALDGILDELAERLAARVAERLRASEPNMVGQSGSPLGARRHCAAVKRRLARGEPGAAILGRRHLLTAEALGEELRRASARKEPGREAPATSVRAELLAELELARRETRRG